MLSERMERALQELKRQMATTDSEWPDITWRVCVRFGVRYEDLADAYDEDCQRQGDR